MTREKSFRAVIFQPKEGNDQPVILWTDNSDLRAYAYNVTPGADESGALPDNRKPLEPATFYLITGMTEWDPDGSDPDELRIWPGPDEPTKLTPVEASELFYEFLKS